MRLAEPSYDRISMDQLCAPTAPLATTAGWRVFLIKQNFLESQWFELAVISTIDRVGPSAMAIKRAADSMASGPTGPPLPGWKLWRCNRPLPAPES
jgi:hypothetical protein